MIVGRIAQIWRHPVKSMQGEQRDAARVGKRGLPGDRGWAVRDEVRGGIRGAKKIPALMNCAARYLEEPGEDDTVVPVPEIVLPNGERLRANASDAAERLSRALDHPVTLWPLQPASDLDHYRRGKPDHEDMQTELRSIFGREEHEPLPDLSVMPPEVFEFESPPGTYFDVDPLLLVTDATLRSLQTRRPDVARRRAALPTELRDRDERRRVGSVSGDRVGRPAASRRRRDDRRDDRLSALRDDHARVRRSAEGPRLDACGRARRQPAGRRLCARRRRVVRCASAIRWNSSTESLAGARAWKSGRCAGARARLGPCAIASSR